MNKEESVLVFMHIPKTAGNTVLHILQQQYVWGMEIHSAYPFEPIPPAISPHLKCVVGHHPFGLHDQLGGRRAVYFTFLREPIDRVLSEYYFTKPYHEYALHDFLKLGGGYRGYEPNDKQTRWSSGGDVVNVALAQLNLETFFPVIGIMELFDESLFLLKKQFGWGDIRYTRQNVNTARRRGRVSRKDLETIRRNNASDIALYNWAVQRLKAQLARLSEEEREELQQFKRKLHQAE